MGEGFDAENVHVDGFYMTTYPERHRMKRIVFTEKFGKHKVLKRHAQTSEKVTMAIEFDEDAKKSLIFVKGDLASSALLSCGMISRVCSCCFSLSSCRSGRN